MNATQRNTGILMVFTACAITAVGAYVWSASRQSSETSQEALLSAQVHPRDLPPIQAPKLERRYQDIVARDLFAPLEGELPAEEPEEEPAEEDPPPRRPISTGYNQTELYGPLPGAPRAPLAEMDIPLPPGWSPVGPSSDGAPEPMQPAGPPGQSANEPSGPPAAEVSVTAVITGSDGQAKVLVEDNSTGDSKWVEPGGQAFGYRVGFATEKGGVLSREGRDYVLAIGENKPSPPPEEPAAPPVAEEDASQGDGTA